MGTSLRLESEWEGALPGRIRLGTSRTVWSRSVTENCTHKAQYDESEGRIRVITIETRVERAGPSSRKTIQGRKRQDKDGKQGDSGLRKRGKKASSSRCREKCGRWRKWRGIVICAGLAGKRFAAGRTAGVREKNTPMLDPSRHATPWNETQ
ncbi:hypothetical protein K438DRAFT_1771631 [Mycena galopus ATCC 62051]|nr:hypothetical protein K438DRAFT_1771631 [Mycena galopus ATCC 62051]